MASTEWKIDLKSRRAEHASGAAASFYEYYNEDDWLTAGANCENPDLYPEGSRQFVLDVKRAVLAAGMKYDRPK